MSPVEGTLGMEIPGDSVLLLTESAPFPYVCLVGGSHAIFSLSGLGTLLTMSGFYGFGGHSPCLVGFLCFNNSLLICNLSRHDEEAHPQPDCRTSGSLPASHLCTRPDAPGCALWAAGLTVTIWVVAVVVGEAEAADFEFSILT